MPFRPSDSIDENVFSSTRFAVADPKSFGVNLGKVKRQLLSNVSPLTFLVGVAQWTGYDASSLKFAAVSMI